MENKYYTPDITEFHPGFEFEFKETFMDGTVKTQEDFDKHEWKTDEVKIGDLPYIERALSGRNAMNNLCGIRVKHLDRADLESEGWIFTEQEGHTFINFKKIIRYRCDKVQCKLNYVFATSWVLIWLLDEKTLFAGRIKNISELRRLQKQLGIN